MIISEASYPPGAARTHTLRRRRHTPCGEAAQLRKNWALIRYFKSDLSYLSTLARRAQITLEKSPYFEDQIFGLAEIFKKSEFRKTKKTGLFDFA